MPTTLIFAPWIFIPSYGPWRAMAASFFQFCLKANTTLPSVGKYITFIQSQNNFLWEIFAINFSNIGMHYSWESLGSFNGVSW